MWFKHLLIVLFVLGALIDIAQIGEHRAPKTVSDALVGIIVAALLIWGTMANWGA